MERLVTTVPQARRLHDVPTLNELVELHDAQLVAICIVAGAHPDLAREAVQNAWVRASRRLDSVRDASRVRQWLIRIAINELRQLWRKQRSVDRKTLPLEAASGARSPVTAGDLDLAAALARLSRMDRELIALTYIAGFAPAEVGAVLGLSAGAIRTRRSRALAHLRKDLQRE